VPKTSWIRSTVFLQCWLVMEMGWFGVVRGHPRSLEIVPFDSVHTSLLAFHSNHVPILHRF